MEAKSLFLHSKTLPLCYTFTDRPNISLRHFSTHLQVNSINPNSHFHQSLKPLKTPSKLCLSHNPLSLSSPTRRTHLLSPLKCSYSSTTSPESQNPLLKPFKNLSFDSLKATLFKLTPFDVIKWSGILSIAIAATKWTSNLVFSPFFWMYFSWTWMFWPWFLAVSVGLYGLYCFRKHLLGEASIFEQLAVVTSVFTWLTLVPPAHFNGFLEGWPYVFFLVYHYFFFFNVSVRKRLYGDYYARPHDPKWDVSPPKWYRLLFSVGVMVGHWLAAFEGPELHRIPGGWSNLGIWGLIVVTMLMQYNSTLYLAKYSEKVVVPTAVVQFGPYRWVRHPIYASTMLLFATYCVALRAPLSLLFVVAVCVLYYDQKAKLEEALMIETFGERYMEYASKDDVLRDLWCVWEVVLERYGQQGAATTLLNLNRDWTILHEAYWHDLTAHIHSLLCWFRLINPIRALHLQLPKYGVCYITALFEMLGNSAGFLNQGYFPIYSWISKHPQVHRKLEYPAL